MRVGQRLFLAVLPAILGVFTVAGLAYWGQYAHEAPHLVIVVAVIAAVASLVVASLNTRYVAQRIERLAAQGATARHASRPGMRNVADAVTGRTLADAGPDELDAIESVVDHLSTAVTVAEAERVDLRREYATRLAEYTELLSAAATTVGGRLQEVRLPLHILLDNRFGDLNENQEEMLGAARTAADDADAELRALADIVALDTGRLVLRADSIRIGDVLRSLVPTVAAEAARVGAHLSADIGPVLPTVVGDRMRMHESLRVLLVAWTRGAVPGSEPRLSADEDHGVTDIVLDGGRRLAPTAATALARRLVHAHGATVLEEGSRLVIRFARVPQ